MLSMTGDLLMRRIYGCILVIVLAAGCGQAAPHGNRPPPAGNAGGATGQGGDAVPEQRGSGGSPSGAGGIGASGAPVNPTPTSCPPAPECLAAGAVCSG